MEGSLTEYGNFQNFFFSLSFSLPLFLSPFYLLLRIYGHFCPCYPCFYNVLNLKGSVDKNISAVNFTFMIERKILPGFKIVVYLFLLNINTCTYYISNDEKYAIRSNFKIYYNYHQVPINVLIFLIFIYSYHIL